MVPPHAGEATSTSPATSPATGPIRTPIREHFVTGGGRNYMGYSNPELDEIGAEGRDAAPTRPSGGGIYQRSRRSSCATCPTSTCSTSRRRASSAPAGRASSSSRKRLRQVDHLVRLSMRCKPPGTLSRSATPGGVRAVRRCACGATSLFRVLQLVPVDARRHRAQLPADPPRAGRRLHHPRRRERRPGLPRRRSASATGSTGRSSSSCWRYFVQVPQRRSRPLLPLARAGARRDHRARAGDAAAGRHEPRARRSSSAPGSATLIARRPGLGARHRGERARGLAVQRAGVLARADADPALRASSCRSCRRCGMATVGGPREGLGARPRRRRAHRAAGAGADRPCRSGSTSASRAPRSPRCSRESYITTVRAIGFPERTRSAALRAAQRAPAGRHGARPAARPRADRRGADRDGVLVARARAA